MKQRKLNEAKEELLRALLLMKYDTKKTLTENQKNIENPLKEEIQFNFSHLSNKI